MDVTLLDRLAVDVDATFEEMVRTHQHFVYGVAVRLTLDRGDAEEVAQDTFVRAYRALTGYEPQRIRMLHLRPWLARIALNVQRNRVRRHRPAIVLDPDAGVDAPSDARDGPEGQADRRVGQTRCAELLDTLPEPYRMAVALRHVEGLGYAELAEVLGRPLGTVKAQVHRGVQLLRNRLDHDRTATDDEEGDRSWKEGA